MQIELTEAVNKSTVDSVWSRIRDKLSDAEVSLPAGVSDPEFSNDESFAYSLIASLVWDVEPDETPANLAILGRLAKDLEERLRTLSGTERKVALNLNDLGALLLETGALEEAELLLTESLETHRRIGGDKHPDVVTVLNNLSFLYEEQGDLRAAEQMLRQ